MAKLKSGTRIYGTAIIDTSATVGTIQIGSGIVTATAGIVTYYGDGSKLINIAAPNATLNISTTTSSSFNYITVVSSSSTSVLGISTASAPLVFIPSTGNLGIGTTNATNTLTVTGSGTSTSQLIVTGVSTLGTLRISSGIVSATTGIVTYYGDASYAVDGTNFNVGVTSAFSTTLTALGANILSLSSTTGRRYLIYSINVANVAAGNTEINVIGAFDFSGGERSYFAYNIPVPTGTSVELLKQPQVLNPSDSIVMRSTDYNRVGIDSIAQVYVTYQEKADTNYFGVGLGTVGIGTTNLTTVYTSTTFPSVVQSIRLANRTDSGAYPVSVSITSGLTTINLVDNLIVPKYASVEILDIQKRLNLNDVIKVQVDQTSTIDVQVSGKKITS